MIEAGSRKDVSKIAQRPRGKDSAKDAAKGRLAAFIPVENGRELLSPGVR
jgi:hypothetical protein